MGGFQGRSGQVLKTSRAPAFDRRTVQPVANRYKGYAIPEHREISIGTIFNTLGLHITWLYLWTPLFTSLCLWFEVTSSTTIHHSEVALWSNSNYLGLCLARRQVDCLSSVALLTCNILICFQPSWIFAKKIIVYQDRVSHIMFVFLKLLFIIRVITCLF
jgi:hypothetical protein